MENKTSLKENNSIIADSVLVNSNPRSSGSNYWMGSIFSGIRSTIHYDGTIFHLIIPLILSLQHASHMLPFISATFNWLIYALLNSQFKKGFVLVTERMLRKQTRFLILPFSLPLVILMCIPGNELFLSILDRKLVRVTGICEGSTLRVVVGIPLRVFDDQRRLRLST